MTEQIIRTSHAASQIRPDPDDLPLVPQP